MFTKEVHELFTLGMVGRHYVQYFGHGEQRPTVGTSPEEGGMISHTFYPTVTEELLFGYPHTLGKLEDLANGFGQIFGLFFICHTRVPGYGRNAHEHIIQPKRVELWTDAGKGSVGKAIFFV